MLIRLEQSFYEKYIGGNMKKGQKRRNSKNMRKKDVILSVRCAAYGRFFSATTFFHLSLLGFYPETWQVCNVNCP